MELDRLGEQMTDEELAEARREADAFLDSYPAGRDSPPAATW